MDSVPTSVDSYFLELYKKKVLFPSPEINIFFAKFPSYFGYFYPKDFFSNSIQKVRKIMYYTIAAFLSCIM